MKINTLNIAKDLGKSLERLLIVLSLMYCMLFLIDIPIYVNYIYILALTCMYILYFYISKMELEVSYVTILSAALLGYIYATTIHAGQLPYKEIKLLMLVNVFIMIQLNSLIFRKHYKFASKSLILILLAFFAFFSIQIITSNGGAFFLVEQYFDNIGIFAIFIALSTIVTLNFIKELELKQTKLIYLLVLLVSLICVLLLESRTAFIILLSFLLLSNLKHIKSKIVKIVSLFILVVLILISATLIKQDSSFGRLFIWKTTSHIIKDNPICGVGYDKFAAVYPIYQASMYEVGIMSDRDVYVADNTKMTLNEYIQITAELGCIGLILLLSIVFTYIYYNRKYTYIYLCVCLAMFFSYILHSPIICYLLVVILSLSYIPPAFKLNRVSSLMVLFLFMILSVYSVDICLQKLNREKITRILWAQSPNKLNVFYDINERYLCDNYKLLFKLAEYNYNHNNIDQALTFLNQLDNTIMKNEIELLKGKCYIKKGDYNLAEKHLLLSVAICPNRFINRYELFKLYLNNGMDEKAINVAKIINNMKEKVPSIHTMAIKNEIFDYLCDKKIFIK